MALRVVLYLRTYFILYPSLVLKVSWFYLAGWPRFVFLNIQHFFSWVRYSNSSNFFFLFRKAGYFKLYISEWLVLLISIWLYFFIIKLFVWHKYLFFSEYLSLFEFTRKIFLFNFEANIAQWGLDWLSTNPCKIKFISCKFAFDELDFLRQLNGPIRLVYLGYYSVFFILGFLILGFFFKVIMFFYTAILGGFTHYIFIFICNLVSFLFLTLIIASITLLERKLLSLVQRRVGPNYVGFKGRLQFIADALKFLLKQIIVVNQLSRLLFLLIPMLVLILSYLFWVNLVWGANLAVCEIEYNLLFMGVLSLFFSFLLFFIGWASNNKYAILSSNRVLVMTLNLEIFLNFIILVLVAAYESFSFHQIVSFQVGGLWGFFIFLPVLPVLLIVFLLETGRIPFDLGEAESELIAGYTTEMGGFFFALFYLGEYFHLFCFAFVYTLCFFGGWIIRVKLGFSKNI